ncbi:uncharacterized protein LOC126240638 [Schistocerca nitens]|uniref:uncharacterized protein LOC126240638 n=1 Tax=Schistocerca nitens TaxID=7011 RepID=UPI002117729A|nr:uncharacterized protein LOC126240638 [Schistocerca nitens]
MFPTLQLLCSFTSRQQSKPFLTVEVDMGYALQPSLHLLLTSPSVFSRLCVILKDLKLACHIIAEVFKVNSANLGSIIPLTDYQSAMASDYNVTKLYYNQRNESAANGLSLSRDRMSMSYLSTELSLQESLILVDTTPITGFAIDGVDKVLVYAEGPANSQFQRLWQAVMHIKENQGNVMYNSDLAFDDRLYTPFLVFACGFMVITLKERLEDTLSRPKIFSEGAVPLPACRALKKLKQLLETREMKDASQGHMFPTVNELLSFDLEFGVPTMCSYETEN